MKYLPLSILITIVFCSRSLSQNNFQKNTEKEIMNLIQQHRESLPEKDVVKIFEMNIHVKENAIKTDKDILFNLMAGFTLRFYVLSEGLDTRIQLWQRKDGILEKKNQKLLWEVNKRATEKGISFYDYKIEKENDFILKFPYINNKKGNASLIVVIISKKGSHF